MSRPTLLTQLACLDCAGSADKAVQTPSPSSPWNLAIGPNGFGSSETQHGKTYVYDEILDFARIEDSYGILITRKSQP